MLSCCQTQGHADRWPTISWLETFLPALWVVVSFCLMADTGYTPLNWQFWMVFLPLYATAECALLEGFRHRST
jgi:hypothetical protein